ncbi:hypothetical protein ACOMHN_051370 [Nucella lapillus]
MQEEASTIIGVCVWGNDNDIRKSFRQNGPIFPELPVQCRLNLEEVREVIGYIIGVLGSIHFKKDSVVNSFHGLIRNFIQLTLHCSNKAQSVILCFIRCMAMFTGYFDNLCHIHVRVTARFTTNDNTSPMLLVSDRLMETEFIAVQQQTLSVSFCCYHTELHSLVSII